jgi:uncharacterized protein YbaR (Trm112 family)
MSFDHRLLDIVCCPATHLPLRLMPESKLATLNARIGAGLLKFRDDSPVTEPLARRSWPPTSGSPTRSATTSAAQGRPSAGPGRGLKRRIELPLNRLFASRARPVPHLSRRCR